MNVMPILIRRELWEHRALWMAPLIVAALLLLAATFGRVIVDLPRGDVESFLTPNVRLGVFAVMQWGLTLVQFFSMAIVLFFYLLDCLYAERKERSILFWKSLPVSDATTVLSKLLVALVVVPLGVYLLALVTDALFAGVLSLRTDRVLAAAFSWDAGVWLRVQVLLLAGLVTAALWYAPIAAYLLLLSAWARRNVFLWAVLPPVIALLAEEIAFNTDYVKTFLSYCFLGVWSQFRLGEPFVRLDAAIEAGEGLPDVRELLASIEATSALQSVNLWLGVAAAALLVWGAIRIRRYRDDT